MSLLYILQIVVLAVVQGLAELLPVSSSAHVIVAEKLMGMGDPSEPKLTLLLVMLHTGTMFAVILYFWRAWKKSLFASRALFKQQAVRLFIATLLTAAVAGPLILGIEKGVEHSGYQFKDANGQPQKFEIELLFNNLGLVAAALAVAGVLIFIAGATEKAKARNQEIGIPEAAWIGAVQGLCLLFRGFSRSGATISTGLLLGSIKARVEEFSFALAVIITPPIIAHELWRSIKKHPEAWNFEGILGLLAPSLVGMVCAFLAGLLALRWLSRWLEGGRWRLFGVYCLVAASAVFALHWLGY